MMQHRAVVAVVAIVLGALQVSAAEPPRNEQTPKIPERSAIPEVIGPALGKPADSVETVQEKYDRSRSDVSPPGKRERASPATTGGPRALDDRRGRRKTHNGMQ
jgi:hypothetical protein